MRTKNTIRMAITDIMCHKMRFFLSIVLIGISIGSIGYFYMVTNVSKYNREECDRLLSRGIDGTAVMQVFGDHVDKLVTDAMNSGFFECIGTWESDVQGYPLPEELMKCRVSNGGDPAVATKWVYIDKTAVGIHNFQFTQKLDVSEEKWNDPQWHGIYLGGNYSGIAVGTIYEIEKIGGYETFEVIGVLKKGHQFVSEGVMIDGRAGWFDALEILDDAIIVPQGENAPIWYWRSCNGGYTPATGKTLDEARGFLEEKAKELGLKLETGYLKDGFYAEEIEQRDIQRVNQELNVVLFFSCLLICSCIIFMQMIEERQQLGILFALGFSRSDIIRIYIYHAFLKVSIALTLSYLCIRYYMKILYEEMFAYGGIGPIAINQSKRLSFYKMLDRWINHAALPEMLCAAVIIFIVCSAIPILLMRNKVPANLLKDMRG